MSRSGLFIFLLLDFATLIAVFLFFTYYGLIYTVLLLFGFLLFFMMVYEMRGGAISLIIRDFLKLPAESGEESAGVKEKKKNISPLLLVAFVVIYSFLQVIKNGLAKGGQSLLPEGAFGDFVFWTVLSGILILILAYRYYESLIGRKKK